MNQTELFQFGFKIVGYGSVFFLFGLAVRFGFLVFLPTPNCKCMIANFVNLVKFVNMWLID
jgi:hypothetical protein